MLCLSGICPWDCFTAGEQMVALVFFTVMLWNMWSYDPAVVVLGLSWEKSQRDIPIIVSGKGFLAFTANLPTHWRKRRGKLDTIENRDIVQRISELEAGAGLDTQLFDSISATMCNKLQHQLQLASQTCTGWNSWVETILPWMEPV